MHSLFKTAHAATMTVALLVLATSFVMMLFGWALHALIAALVFSSCFTLAQELRSAILTRQPARLRR
jgi:hypothetical protein